MKVSLEQINVAMNMNFNYTVDGYQDKHFQGCYKQTLSYLNTESVN